MPTTVLVHVLWAQIVALGRHPLPRYTPQITFQPEGRARRVSVQTLISGTDDLWLGTRAAFRAAPLPCTLIVWQAYGQVQP